MRLGISLDGAKAADWAAVCIARHGWHCDVLFCPHCPHSRSAVLWHSGQTCRRYSRVAHPASTSGSSGTLLVVKMETQSSRWEPCSASPQHEVEQSRGPVEGAGKQPRRWRLRGSVGAEARQCPLNSASLAWMMQRGTGQQRWTLQWREHRRHVPAFSPLASGRARKTPGKRQGHAARHSAG